jgi:hypothetical protein
MKKTLFASLLVSVLGVFSASASIVVSGDVTDTNGTFTLQITEDITLDIETTGSAYIFVFDEWVTSDGTHDNSFDNPNGASLQVQVNGGSETPYGIDTLCDNLDGVVGDATANDGFFVLYDFVSVSAGDTLTIKAATYTFDGLENFNEDAIGTFNGNVFLTDSNGIRLSSIETVPEPATLGMVGAVAGAILFIRRRFMI